MSTRRIRAPFELRRPAAYSDTGAGPSRLISVVLVAGVLLAELVLAAAVTRPGATILLYPLAGAAGLALTFAYPFIAACLFLALVDSVLYSTYYSVSFGITATLPEILLGALLVVAVLRPRRETWGGVAGAALACYLALVVAASVLAVSAGRVDAQTSRDFTLPFCYLLFFYAAIRLFPEAERMRRLLWVAVAMAGVTGVVALLVSAGGSETSVLQDPTGGTISSDNGVGRFLRVRLPGVALAYGLFWYAVVMRGQVRGNRVWWTLALVGMGLSIAISLNRNMWIGLVFGLALILVVGGAHTRRNLLLSLVAAAAAIAALVLVGPQSVGPASAITPIVKRGETLLSPGQELQDQSLKDRGTETKAAWHALQGHLVLGLGVGAPFGVAFRYSLGGGRSQISDQTFLHNQYLYVIVAGGVLGLLAFLTFLGATMRTAWEARGRDPTLPALLVGLAMIMLSAFVMIAFVADDYMVLLALIGAAVFTLAAAPDPALPAA